jgi:hypothetical protein
MGVVSRSRVVLQLKMLWNSRGSILVSRHFPQRPPPGQNGEEEEEEEGEEEEAKEEDLNLEEVLSTGTNIMTYALVRCVCLEFT